MTGPMLDGNLRRKRRTFENFWLRALRGDNNDATNSGIVLEKAASSKVAETWRRARTTPGDQSPEHDVAGVAISPATTKTHHPENPPREADDVMAQPMAVRRVGRAWPPAPPTPTQRQTPPRYVTRVQGPTLAVVLDRIRQNEGDVRELDFSNLSSRNKRLEPYGGVLVARVLTHNCTVTRLVLRDHAIGDRGAVALANMLRFNSTIESIDLYSNGISDVGAEAIAHALYGHESLTHLALWSNEISNRGARALADALKCNRTLKHLGLVHNRLTADGAQALLDALEVNTHLETLNLATNRIPYGITSQIRVTLARNRSEAPRVSTSMKTAEADVRKRLEEEHEQSGHAEDDDAASESSGFMSSSDADTDEEDETGADSGDDDGVWI